VFDRYGKEIYALYSTTSESVHLWLTAVPMAAGVERIAGPLAAELKKITSAAA